jgi:MFS transporter, DHA1 family, multidrug resistance protein
MTAPPHAAPIGRRAPTHRQLVLLLGGLSAFGPLSMDMYLPGLPDLAHELSAPASAAQLTITSCMLGLALGQLLAGPVSDALGRRRPLLVGLAAYTAASALCAAAPGMGSLVLLRLVQGVAGAAGIVIARAIVRDLHSGVAAARFFSLLVLVAGLAPILAPLVGGQLLHVTDWRGIFLVLAAIGLLLLAASWRLLDETLPTGERHGGGLSATLRVFGRLLRERGFVGYALACGMSFAAMAAYISGSPFVLQDIYGVSPQAFSALFALNAGGIMAASQIGARTVERAGPSRLLALGLGAGAVGGVGLLAAILLDAGLGGVLPCLFVVVSSVGLVLPNALALALTGHPRTAGSAAALMGLSQFALGAAAAPLVGVAGAEEALPLGIVVATLGVGSVLAAWLLAERGGR